MSTTTPFRAALGGNQQRLLPGVRPHSTGRYVRGHSVYRNPTGNLGAISYGSRVQPTAYLLGQNYFSSPTTPRPDSELIRAGMNGAATALASQGLGAVGASWLTQGVVLALTGTFIDRMLRVDSVADKAEELARTQEAARKLNNPFTNANRVGSDVAVVIDQRGHNPAHGLGRLHLGNAAASVGINTAATISAAAIKSGGSLATSSTWLAAAGGPIGAGVAGATIALAYLMTRQRPARKIATTEIVNEVEPLLVQSLNSYMAGPRTPESQLQALNNFDAGWDFVVTHCGDPNMGEPGKWCINDRKRGGKWDWFKLYRDPIANDTQPQEIAAQRVASNTAIATGNPTGSQTMVDPQTGQPIVVQSGGEDITPLLMLLGLGAGVYLLMS